MLMFFYERWQATIQDVRYEDKSCVNGFMAYVQFFLTEGFDTGLLVLVGCVIFTSLITHMI